MPGLRGQRKEGVGMAITSICEPGVAEHFSLLIVVMRLYQWFRDWNIVKQDVPFGGGEREKEIQDLYYIFLEFSVNL